MWLPSAAVNKYISLEPESKGCGGLYEASYLRRSYQDPVYNFPVSPGRHVKGPQAHRATPAGRGSDLRARGLPKAPSGP
jgi:hypothetical protein